MTDVSPRSVDELFDVLSSPHRRQALRLLRERDGPVTREDLARELDGVSGAAGGGDRGAREKQMRSVLYHVHMPKLEAADLVEYDRERGVLCAASRAEAVGPVLAWESALRRYDA